MKDFGLISVIIPVYNVEKYLRQCLESVLNQTYTNYEVIMVDDGSTDSSYEICLEYCKKDSRFKAFHKENGGASSARNYALKIASGQYISFVDSDDWIDEDALEQLICKLEENDVDFVFYEAAITDDTGMNQTGSYSYHKDYGTNVPYRLMREMVYHKEFHVSIPLLFIKRDFFIKHNISFYEGIMCEDMILAYQIFALADRAVHLPKAIYHRRYRENSVVTSKKTEKNFISTNTVYKSVVEFSETVSVERRNYSHVIRCAFNALNDYRALNAQEKNKLKREYQQLKKDILSHHAFGNKALRYRCSGYPIWVVYKVLQKLFIGDKADYGIYSGTGSNFQKKVMMLMPHMIGGGAERVAAQLINCMHKNGLDTKFFLTGDMRNEVVRSDLDDTTPLWLFKEEMPKNSLFSKLWHKVTAVLSSLLCKPFEVLKKPVPAVFAILSITSQYYKEIRFLRGLLMTEPDLTVITFLQPTIPITALASQGLPNRVIISERGNPERLMNKRYGKKFIEKYYKYVDVAVFQTYDAKAVYPKTVSDKGTVIFNPLKENLPEPYHGERNKNITTFCRISNQKNLPVLVDAFATVHKAHPDYKLRIIGDAPNDEGIQVVNTIKKMIAGHQITDSVIFEPFNADVHRMILEDAMYVNSSDYEGISNAMLEAMAIGMPVVCTDCPIGGAKATIIDGENGLLTPIKDAEALSKAILRVIEEDGLAEKLSQNASKLRDELSLEKITNKWQQLL